MLTKTLLTSALCPKNVCFGLASRMSHSLDVLSTEPVTKVFLSGDKEIETWNMHIGKLIHSKEKNYWRICLPHHHNVHPFRWSFYQFPNPIPWFSCHQNQWQYVNHQGIGMSSKNPHNQPIHVQFSLHHLHHDYSHRTQCTYCPYHHMLTIEKIVENSHKTVVLTLIEFT